MSQHESTAVVLDYLSAVERGDADVIRNSFAPDATWSYPGDLPLSGTWEGRDAILHDFLGALGAYVDTTTIDFHVTSVVTEGDTVCVEWTSRVRTVGGEAYENHNMAAFVVRDGLIAEVREYTDTAYAARVLFAQRVT
jgi:uncharacterized protein